MFIGEYTHIIDSKKRLAIPAKFRAGLGKEAVVTRGLERSLCLYPKQEWQALAEKLSRLPFSQADARGVNRFMLASAMEVEIDRAGRILIPDYLKEYADLKKEVTVIGLHSRIEIWNKRIWATYRDETEKALGDMTERLKELGF